MLAYIGRRDLLNLSTNYSANLAAQLASAERLEKQAWLRNGQTQLAEQVLGQLTLNLLGRNILQFCAQYLGTAVAALYCVKNMAASSVWRLMVSPASRKS